MRRMGLMVLALIASALPAFAQNRSWVPWGETGGYVSSSPQQARRASPGSKPQQRIVRGQRRNADDDDDDSFFGSPFGSPGGQLPYKNSAVQYPAILEGGPRPDIAPKAPPLVPFQAAGFAQGAIVIDTGARSLYYVLGNGSAYRYPISVGRDGFRWKGTEKISRVAAWPDWHPPQEMRERDPKLPEVMTGGIRNPLGAKALYLGNSLYRIHGTNDAKSIGYAASSGCFRMMNQNVMHLATLAGPGTTVQVLERLPSAAVADTSPGAAKPKVKRQS